MNRILAALAIVCLSPALACAQGLNITNFRPAYSMPPGAHGPTRVDAASPKLVAGDVLYAEYTIEGLTAEPKTGKVRYEIVLEFVDSAGSPKLVRKTPNETVPQLNGNRMPGSLFLSIGPAFPPGKYTIKLTVDDKVANKKAFLNKAIQVIPTQLAFIQVEALAVALPGEPIGARCMVVGFGLDNKKLPNLDVTVRVLDGNGKAVSNPAKTEFPAALPPGVNAANVNELPVVYPLTPNRPGQFVIDLGSGTQFR